MPKLLQINITSNWGSTGKIAEAINLAAQRKGWECSTAYGRWANPSKFPTYKVLWLFVRVLARGDSGG